MSNRTALDRFGFGAAVGRFVWNDDPPSRWHAALLGVLQLVWAVGRDLAAGQITLRAMSLVYTTLLSLVPLLAISFSILKGFGVHNQIEPFLHNALEPLGERRDEIVTSIVSFVDNVQVGVLGFLGFLLLFYTVISLIQKIEHAFNDVWQVSATRTFAERFKDYLSVIIVGPVLIFTALGIMATVMSDPLMERIISIRPVGWLVELAGRLVPVAMVVLAFTFVYIFVPHTRVRLGPAFAGGLVAGILWNAVGWLFAGFVSRANQYTAIYSGFATPILFMIWLYVSWLILLVGACIAFYRQHPEYLPGRQLTGRISTTDRERLALAAICLIGQRFYAGNPPETLDDLAQRLAVPSSALEQVMEVLEARGLIVRTESASPSATAYLPGCPWENASVHDLLEAMRDAGHDDRLKRFPLADHPGVAAVLRERRSISEQTFGSWSLKRLATEHGESAPATPQKARTAVAGGS